ncbi:sigma-70 family RNA polymerase sigma factor [Bacillus sp. EB01]|uniref:sigma-70 family RNA polymerase sigma factor n=1 Tax=Bacillus sp. EB01 TaxID=1347086 RepID=UPI000AD4E2BA
MDRNLKPYFCIIVATIHFGLRLKFERVWKMLRKKKSDYMEVEFSSKEETLEWLMNEYGRSVVRLAFTFMKKEQLAEDIAQEVFIKCYEKLDTFRNESSYKTWIYRITVNLCKDRLKSWSYKNIIIAELLSKKSTNFKTPESELINVENQKALSVNVLSLPIKYREINILYYYEELTYNQIAELLNISLQTVKSRLHRARLLLKKMIEGGKSNG